MLDSRLCFSLQWIRSVNLSICMGRSGDSRGRSHQCWRGGGSQPPHLELKARGCETESGRKWEGPGGMGWVYASTLQVALRLYQPVENDSAQLCLYAAQQLQLEEVLTQAIGAPVGGAHAAETGVAAKRHRHVWVQQSVRRQRAPSHRDTDARGGREGGARGGRGGGARMEASN